MNIDCIADLHGHYPTLEGGDLLIVAGDLTARDTPEEWAHYFLWQGDQDYKKMIFIAGNHDNRLQSHNMAFYSPNHKVEYLCDSGTEFEGLRIWGSPWTLKFPGMNPKAMAFTCDTEEELAEKWALIPNDIDILVTHSPPVGFLDYNTEGYVCGSISLRNRLMDMSIQKLPKLHVFGHIHECFGEGSFFDMKCVNASHVNERYQPVNKPIRVIL